MSDDEMVDGVRRAISDPGATTPRRPDESVPAWSTRAALAVVDLPAVRAEAERAGAAKALASIKDRALDPVQHVTEGPMVSRIKVAGWCDSLLRAAEVESGVTGQERVEATTCTGAWDTCRVHNSRATS